MNSLLYILLSTVVSTSSVSPQWTDDYGEALINARCDRRPMVVVIENPEKVSQRAGSIFHVKREILTRFEICRVDVGSEYGKKVADLYGPSALPYTVITDSDCEQIVFRSAGERSIRQWTRTLAVHVEETEEDANPDESLEIADASDAIDQAAASSSTESAIASTTPSPDPKAPPKPSIPFAHPDLEAARAAAADRNCNLLVFVSMENCPFCDKMQDHTFSDAPVHQRIAEQYESVKIMKRDHAAMVAEHDVKLFPTTLIFSPDGNLLTRIDGFVESFDFLSRVPSGQ